MTNPVVHAIEIYSEILLVILSNRIEETNALDIPAVPTIATVGNHQVIKRTLFRASARKSDTNHYISVFVQREADMP